MGLQCIQLGRRSQGLASLTYFVDHRRPHERCDHGRAAHLYEDYHNWEQRLLQIWHGQLNLEQTHEFHIVHPRPPLLQPSSAVSSSLCKRREMIWLALSSPFLKATSSYIFKAAALLPHQNIFVWPISWSAFCCIIDVLVMPQHMYAKLGMNVFHSYHRDIFPGRSGYGIVLQVRPRPPPNVVFTDIDDPVLLQLDHLIPHHPLQLREDVEVPEKLVPVRLQSGQNDLQVPSFLEIRTDGDWCS